jgi:hypothetical protein
MQKIQDLESAFGNYKPLSGIGWEDMFISDIEKPTIITGHGKNLFRKRPDLFAEVLNGSTGYGRRSMVASGLGGEVYRLDLGSEALAEKRYTGRENGIVQIQDLAKIGLLAKDLPRVRAPKTYYASHNTLLMEYIDAPTWEQVVNRDPGMQNILLGEFSKSGGLRLLSRNKILVDNSSKFVRLNQDGEYEFILADPVVQS